MAENVNLPDSLPQELPAEVQDWMAQYVEAKNTGADVPVATIDSLFSRDDMLSVRTGLKDKGWSWYRNRNNEERFIAVDADENGQVFAIAAGIPRTQGRAEDYLDDIADFQESFVDEDIGLWKRIYENEGLVNNAINKSAALVAVRGSFKVRHVKGKRGVPTDQRVEELRRILDWWAENVNARADDAVITGARGVTALLAQGVRQCLIEGDHIARQIWTTVNIPDLSKAYSLPMNIQSFSRANIEAVEGLEPSTAELLWWVPPADFIQLIKDVQGGDVDHPLIKEVVDKLVPREIQQELVDNGKYLLDPSLLLHVKHRGTGTDIFGESFVKPAMPDIVYKRALDALDLVTIENLINRLVIVKVGSDSPDSVYHRQEVTSKRLGLLETLFRNVGPSATILWGGPDIDVVEVGAYDGILAMDDRYAIARTRIRDALGVPAALLTGESSGGKAVGWAATVGLAAQLGELQNQYGQALKSLAERIALENGFEDVDVVWEFNQSLLVNKTENAAVAKEGLNMGAIDFETYLDQIGLSFEAVYNRMLWEVSVGIRDEPFGPIKALMTTNPTGDGGEDGGRPKQTEDPGRRDPQEDKERQTDQENS